MAERTVRAHAFASVKGGVGKSTLAVFTAKFLALQKRRPLLIDCDMTGTSFADGLRLCAPKVMPGASGVIDLLQPPTGEHETLEDTRRLRAIRRDAPREKTPLPPPFLNDVLRFLDDALEERRAIDDPRVDALLWRHESDDGVLYLPSSPLRRDVGESLGWISIDPGNRFDWVHRLTWVLHYVLKQRRDITDVVFDLPPGIAGLTHAMMVLLSELERGGRLVKGYPPWNQGNLRWTVNPILVLTADRNDLLPGLEYIGQTRDKIHSLLPLVNRTDTAPEVLRDQARHALGSTLATLGLERRLRFIDEHRPTLGQIFRRGDLGLGDLLRGGLGLADNEVALASVLRLTGEDA
jgi:hypothetical protein